VTITEVFADLKPPDKSWLGQSLPEMEPTVRAPCIVRDGNSGEPVMYVAKYPGELATLRRALLTYPMSPSGVPRASGWRSKTSNFGYVGRRALMKRDNCRTCAPATQAPEQHRIIAGAATVLAKHLAEVLPERFEHDLGASGIVLPDWKLTERAPWTSGVVNWLCPMPYHYDRNNLDAWSAMPVVRRGIRGGHLHVPEYGLVVECRDGDVVYFAGYNLMHGVTPMRKTDDDGYRVSAVYYAVKDLKDCLPADQELQYGQQKRTEREGGMLDRQRASGLYRG